MQVTDILLSQGLITDAHLATAFEESQVSGRTLGMSLVYLGVITESQLVAALAHQIGMDFVDLEDFPVEPAAVARLSEHLARRYTVLPIAFQDGDLLLATADPGNVMALDEVKSATGLAVRAIVATRADVLNAIDRYCRSDDELEDLASSALEKVELEAPDLSNLSEVGDDEAPIVRFVNLLVTQAIQDRASDIHLGPGEQNLRVRYRIDGVLHEVQSVSRDIQSGVISRVKIMSDIDIAERRKPQDGRMSVTHNGKKVDLRVATLPTVWGEKIVMRILDNATASYDLMKLGFSDENLARYEESYSKPYGMILVTGPTGSGKSTTLYATLNIVSRPEINVITVEDPVEYRLPNINQVQVNPKAGLTFASALRSILRSDPDVVLLGEIRDHETAQISVEAALTGHLVLSTLHTNDAPSAITRLTEMGIEPFLVGSAVDSVLAQRLARKLCDRCKQPYEVTEEEIKLAGFPIPAHRDLPMVYKPVGCGTCAGTGYKGRMALHEVMAVSEEIERLAVKRASSHEIAEVARSQGMTTLRNDGWNKVLQGHTSIEEVLRIVI